MPKGEFASIFAVVGERRSTLGGAPAEGDSRAVTGAASGSPHGKQAGGETPLLAAAAGPILLLIVTNLGQNTAKKIGLERGAHQWPSVQML